MSASSCSNGDANSRPSFFDACLFESLHASVDDSKMERMEETVRAAAAAQAKTEAELRVAQERLRQANARTTAAEQELARIKNSTEMEIRGVVEERVAAAVKRLKDKVAEAEIRAIEAENRCDALQRREEELMAAVLEDAEAAEAGKQVCSPPDTPRRAILTEERGSSPHRIASPLGPDQFPLRMALA